MPDNPYEVLGVSQDATESVIKEAYNKLVKEHHPDVGGELSKFLEIKDAYECIIQEDSNDEYRVGDNEFSFKELDRLITEVTSESVAGSLSDDLTIVGDQLTISVLNVSRVDTSDYTSKEDIKTKNRLCIFYYVENTSDYVQKFSPRETRIVVENRRRYDSEFIGMGVDVMSESLPHGLYSESREMEPHTRSCFVTPIEEISKGVEIDKIIFPFKLFKEHQIDGAYDIQRYVFDIQPHHREYFRLIHDDGVSALESGDTSEEARSDSNSDEKSGREEVSSNTFDEIPLTKYELDRVRDIADLQPTSNSELQERWNVDSGSDLYNYVKSNLSDYYTRNSNKKIILTEEGKNLLDSRI